jgi:endonuclease YncB( thermonuclease family)
MYRLFLIVCSLPTLASGNYLDCPCNVVKVVDGDTVHVLDQKQARHKIRLGGIDAPERKQPFGRKSTNNLAGYVAGEFIEIEYSKIDRYGRIIGKLIKNGTDINLQQIKNGFAWHYKRYEGEQSVSDRKLYGDAEVTARMNKIGLWAESAIPPWEFRRRN